MTRAEAIADAYLWLGTPYLHQASVRGVGTDCLGLVGGVARDRGTAEGLAWAADPNFKGYGRTPHARTLLEGTDKYLERIRLAEVTAGDILLMKFAVEPQHFAFISRMDPTYIIHASSSHRKVVEHRLDEVWRSRVIRAYRYRGLE